MIQPMKRMAAAAGVLLGIVALGCVPAAGPPATVQAVSQPLVDTSYPRAKLIIGSEDLAGKIAIVDPRLRKAGLLSQAEVTVENLTDDRYTLEYKYDWEDEQGFTVDSRSVWHRFTLTSHQTQRFQSTGKNPQATTITFTVRYPDDAYIESHQNENYEENQK